MVQACFVRLLSPEFSFVAGCLILSWDSLWTELRNHAGWIFLPAIRVAGEWSVIWKSSGSRYHWESASGEPVGEASMFHATIDS
jgi:hypothetical protein